MCGIYGIAKSPKPYTKRQSKIAKKVLRHIAIDSQTRGSHSSGIASIGEQSNIYKSLLPSGKFVDSKEYNSAVKSLDNGSNILLGHTRFATEGAIVKNNAHPFQVGGVIGAHNGCVYNIAEMQTQLDKQCPVDSQLIFKSIDATNNIQDAVADFDSDFALSYVKNNPMILHLCRESNRPLSVAYVPQLKTLYYASESDFIVDALRKEGIIGVDVVKLNKNTLYSYNVAVFGDTMSNVVKTTFNYESRVYQHNINSYSSSLGSAYYDYEFTDYDYVSDEIPEYDKDGLVSRDWQSMNKQELCRIYVGTRPSEWFYDSTEHQWYYMNVETNELMNEYQVAEMMYDFDETELKYA
jgi:glucosamine 6-phosphate synthetase-like amidotransferase/phosphosugar isomerase protein|tara:strand:- start:22 stop:1077 length:1056 start_codon:yes stop_codon:yes gene_type:complete